MQSLWTIVRLFPHFGGIFTGYFVRASFKTNIILILLVMRNNLILFLGANMPALIDAIKADTNAYGLSGNITKSKAKAWMNNANTTDERLQEVATSLGWTPDSAPVAKSAPTVEGVDVQNIDVETTNGETVSVPCFMLTVKKWDVSKSKSPVTGKVTFTPVLKCAYGEHTLSIHHELFREKSVRDSIVAGDSVPVREETVQQLANVNYVAYRGAILEADVPSMQEARMNLNERELAKAELSVEAQKLLSTQSAQAEVSAFLAKFGK